MRGFELKGCIPNSNKKNKKQSTQKKRVQDFFQISKMVKLFQELEQLER